MNRGESLSPNPVDALYWLAGFGLIWWLLSGGRGPIAGAIFAVVASALMLALGMTPRVLHFRHAPGFVLFYFRELFFAGWDVARRAFHPRLPLSPQWVTYPLRESSDRVRQLLSAIICLLPGTLASHLEEGTLYIHVLSGEQPWQRTIERLESRLMALLGERPS